MPALLLDRGPGGGYVRCCMQDKQSPYSLIAQFQPHD